MADNSVDFGPICDNNGFVHPDEETFCAAKANDSELTANNECSGLTAENCEIPCCENSCTDVIAAVVVID